MQKQQKLGYKLIFMVTASSKSPGGRCASFEWVDLVFFSFLRVLNRALRNARWADGGDGFLWWMLLGGCTDRISKQQLFWG